MKQGALSLQGRLPHRGVWAVLVALSTFLISAVCSAQTKTTEPPPPEPVPGQLILQDVCSIDATPTIVVPKQAKTIQEAINGLGTKGTVIVLPGIYRENVTIPAEGHHIVIRSTEGPRHTIVRAKDPTLPAIGVGPSNRVCIMGLRIRGGSAGIAAGEVFPGQKLTQPINVAAAAQKATPGTQVARAKVGRPAEAIAIRHTSISQARRGLLLFAKQIDLRSIKAFRNIRWGGVLIGELIEIFGSLFSDNKAGGLSVLEGGLCDGPSVIESEAILGDLDVSGNDGPGLVVCGAEAVVLDSNFFTNEVAGAFFFEAQGTNPTFEPGLLFSSVGSTEPAGAAWGDGVVIVDSPVVDVKNNAISVNERVGVFYYGPSSGEVEDNYIILNTFSIALEADPDCTEGGPDPAIGENFIDFNEVNDVSVGLGLCPPPPVEPLED